MSQKPVKILQEAPLKISKTNKNTTEDKSLRQYSNDCGDDGVCYPNEDEDFELEDRRARFHFDFPNFLY